MTEKQAEDFDTWLENNAPAFGDALVIKFTRETLDLICMGIPPMPHSHPEVKTLYTILKKNERQ